MLNGKKVAILVEDGFEDAELIETLRSLKACCARVVFIGGGTKDTYQGVRGNATVRVDAVADRVAAGDFDAVIIPGGGAAEKMCLSSGMVDLVRKAHDAGKVVAAISRGPQLLITAGIAKGRRVTSWPSLAADFKNAGGEWVDAPVVQDGNIITARKTADLPRFDKAIIEALRDE